MLQGWEVPKDFDKVSDTLETTGSGDTANGIRWHDRHFPLMTKPDLGNVTLTAPTNDSPRPHTILCNAIRPSRLYILHLYCDI